MWDLMQVNPVDNGQKHTRVAISSCQSEFLVVPTWVEEVQCGQLAIHCLVIQSLRDRTK